MKQLMKRLMVITLVVLSIIVLLAIGVSIFIHNELEKRTHERISYYQSIKSVLLLNFDSDSENKLKADRKKFDYGGISIYYHDNFSEILPLTKETIDWAKAKNRELFGDIKERHVDLIVFEDREEMSEFADLPDISGFYSDFDRLMAINYSNKEYILQKNETQLYFFQKSILHEYTHYIFQRMVDKSKEGISAYPTWFNEGISEYVGNDQTTVEYSISKVVPFDQLHDGTQWQEARNQEGTNVYEQSYFAVKYLIDAFGTDTLKQIIQTTNQTGDFETSFKEATGIPTSELETKITQMQ